jgi:hypothetical protein
MNTPNCKSKGNFVHILAGLLVAGLSGFRKGVHSARENPPRTFTGPVQTAHSIPGRIRFLVPSLRGNQSGREMLMNRLPHVRGVRKVQVNVISGSVLVNYEEGTVSPRLLFAAVVRLLRLDEELYDTPPSLIKRELREVLHSLNLAVYDRTYGTTDLWTGLSCIFGFYGLIQLLSDGSDALSEGGNLLMWALNDLSGPGSCRHT